MISDDLKGPGKSTKTSSSLSLNGVSGSDTDKAGTGKDKKINKKHEFAKRVDEVRDLVDCGGSDLGFCDMSSKYPG